MLRTVILAAAFIAMALLASCSTNESTVVSEESLGKVTENGESISQAMDQAVTVISHRIDTMGLRKTYGTAEKPCSWCDGTGKQKK